LVRRDRPQYLSFDAFSWRLAEHPGSAHHGTPAPTVPTSPAMPRLFGFTRLSKAGPVADRESQLKRSCQVRVHHSGETLLRSALARAVLRLLVIFGTVFLCNVRFSQVLPLTHETTVTINDTRNDAGTSGFIHSPHFPFDRSCSRALPMSRGSGKIHAALGLRSNFAKQRSVARVVQQAGGPDPPRGLFRE
jgi:hypothetical protein